MSALDLKDACFRILIHRTIKNGSASRPCAPDHSHSGRIPYRIVCTSTGSHSSGSLGHQTPVSPHQLHRASSSSPCIESISGPPQKESCLGLDEQHNSHVLLQKRGGRWRRSLKLSCLFPMIWRWPIHHNIHLLVEHLPGTDNNIADLLSRVQQQVHEWKLYPRVLLPYFHRRAFPQIDLFTTAGNVKCPNFTSRLPHPLSKAIDG